MKYTDLLSAILERPKGQGAIIYISLWSGSEAVSCYNIRPPFCLACHYRNIPICDLYRLAELLVYNIPY